MKLCRSLCILAVVAAFAASSYAQAVAATSLKVQEQKLASKLMAREMPYRVLLPNDYETAKAERYAVIYLLHGLYGHYTNWTDKTKVAEYAAKYRFIIVTPEGADGWYIDSPLASHENYESYIVRELIPEIDAKFRTKADRNDRVIAGLSMGGYGALKFGLKYPEMFSLIGSFSGAFGTSDFTEKTAGEIGKKVDSVYGPVGSEARRANDVYLLLGAVKDVKALPFVYLSIGTEDFLFDSNRSLDALLIKQKVPHEYREHPGGHEWDFWDDQVREFLAVADRYLAAPKK